MAGSLPASAGLGGFGRFAEPVIERNASSQWCWVIEDAKLPNHFIGAEGLARPQFGFERPKLRSGFRHRVPPDGRLSG